MMSNNNHNATRRKLSTEAPNKTNKSPSSTNSTTADDVLSRRLNELSIEERSSALYDLHGVADQQVPETPEMIQSKISEMTEALACAVDTAAAASTTTTTTTTPEKEEIDAYHQAMALSPNYVNSLKLRFLRADLYQPKTAAKRMIRFFGLKLELFGIQHLVEDITFHGHLTEEEQVGLRNGVFQLLPQRDRSGRSIFLYDGKTNCSCPNTETVLRMLLYFAMVAYSQDEESQRHGIVFVFYGIGQPKTFPGRPKAMLRMINTLPWNVVAAHHCKGQDNSDVLDVTVRAVHKELECKTLVRSRFHTGTHMECVYALMTFGIPKEALVLDDDGNLDLSCHRQTLQSLLHREQRQQQQQIVVNTAPTTDHVDMIAGSPSPFNKPQEANNVTSTTAAAAAAPTIILVPGPKDVVTGRGRHPKNCTGALRLQNLLLEHRDEYEAAARQDKAAIAIIVLKEMKQSGCRFLTTSSCGGYIECDDFTAREKISHGFRNMRMKSKKKETQTQEKMTTKKKKKSSSSSVPAGGAAAVAKKRNWVDTTTTTQSP